MKLLMWIALVTLAGCCTNPPYEHDFCEVHEENLICSEVQPDGSYKDVDRSLQELLTRRDSDGMQHFKAWVLIPSEDFEARFGQK